MNTITDMNTIYDFRSTLTQICPKCDSGRGFFTFEYGRQLFEEPMGLTITCRCGYYWYERAADYEEPMEKEDEMETKKIWVVAEEGCGCCSVKNTKTGKHWGYPMVKGAAEAVVDFANWLKERGG